MRTTRSVPVLAMVMSLVLLIAGCCCVYEARYNISGTVTDENGVGMDEVALGFGDKFGTAQTDEKGQWNKIGLYGTVKVTPVKAGYRFEPEIRVTDLNTAESVDFIGYPKPLDLEFTSVLVKEVKESSWIPDGSGQKYSYGILGIVTNAGGSGELKIEILGMPYGVDDAPWDHLQTYGPRPIGPGSADIVISIPSSETRYGWLKFELYGLVDSSWVLSQEVIEEVK